MLKLHIPRAKMFAPSPADQEKLKSFCIEQNLDMVTSSDGLSLAIERLQAITSRLTERLTEKKSDIREFRSNPTRDQEDQVKNYEYLLNRAQPWLESLVAYQRKVRR
jgi:hypothetical protein